MLMRSERLCLAVFDDGDNSGVQGGLRECGGSLMKRGSISSTPILFPCIITVLKVPT